MEGRTGIRAIRNSRIIPLPPVDWDGFDPARDIAGITVNRWPHGYAYSYDAETNDVAWWDIYWRHERCPWVDARQRVGNIAFAAHDAATAAMTESAIEEGYRAVHELM